MSDFGFEYIDLVDNDDIYAGWQFGGGCTFMMDKMAAEVVDLDHWSFIASLDS